MLYGNFRSLAFLGLLGFLRRQLKIKFIATLLSAAKKASNDSLAAAFLPGSGGAGALARSERERQLHIEINALLGGFRV